MTKQELCERLLGVNTEVQLKEVLDVLPLLDEFKILESNPYD